MMYAYGLEYYWISKHQRDTNGKEALTSTKCTCVCMLFFFFSVHIQFTLIFVLPYGYQSTKTATLVNFY